MLVAAVLPQVLPAGAGVILIFIFTTSFVQGAPRRRGGDPYNGTLNSNQVVCSPQARG